MLVGMLGCWDDEMMSVVEAVGSIQNHFIVLEYKVNVASMRRKIERLMLRIFNLGFGYQKKIKIVTMDRSYYWELLIFKYIYQFIEN